MDAQEYIKIIHSTTRMHTFYNAEKQEHIKMHTLHDTGAHKHQQMHTFYNTHAHDFFYAPPGRAVTLPCEARRGAEVIGTSC